MMTLALFPLLWSAAAVDDTRYHFDLTRLFATPAAEAAERETALGRASEFERTPAQSIGDAPAFAGWLAMLDAVHIDLRRHEAYVYLRAERDRNDRAAADADNALGAADDAVDAAARRLLTQLGKSRLDGFIAQDAAVARYRYFIDSALRAEERSGDRQMDRRLTQPVLDALGNAYAALRREALQRARDEGAASDAAQAFHAKWQPFLERETAFAGYLVSIATLHSGAAQLQGFDSAPDAAYFRAGLSAPHVAAMLAAVHRSTAFREYLRVVADAAAKQRHLAPEAVHAWDLDAADTYRAPAVAFPDAVGSILAATRRVGGDYAREYRQLFDPRRGRVEWCRSERCDDAGFSVGFAGMDSGLFYGAYAGSTDNLRALAHEAGHAVHRQLMKRHQPIAVYNSGPHFVFESFAIFNQLLVLDELAHDAAVPAAKAYYLHQFLEHATFDVFGSARETELEQAIYAGVADGSVRSAADLDALTLRIFSSYDAGPALDPDMKVSWARDRLYFTDPLYDVNYLYAGLLALDYLREFERDPRDFSRRYVALLENGFDDTPHALLRRFLDIDLDDADALVRNADAYLGARTRALSLLYANAASSVNAGAAGTHPASDGTSGGSGD